MLEPFSISTIVLFAGFATSKVPTRMEEWGNTSSSYVSASPRTNILVSPSPTPAPSEQLTVSTASEALALDRLSLLQIELNLYRGLKDGWDGPESRAPLEADISAALTLIEKLPPGLPIPKAMLSTTGNVGLYWDTPKVFADIALEGGGSFSLFTRRKSGSHAETFVDAIEISAVTPTWLLMELAVLHDA